MRGWEIVSVIPGGWSLVNEGQVLFLFGEQEKEREPREHDFPLWSGRNAKGTGVTEAQQMLIK